MGWIQKFICWLILIINACNKIEFSNASRNEDFLSTYNQVLDILKLCVPDRLNPLIVSNDLIDLIYPPSWQGDDYSTSIMIIDDDFETNNIQLYNPAYPTYLLSADSIVKPRSLISNLQSSSWWNIISHFFVIETRENLCKDSSKVLQLLWKADLLSSFYICSDSNNKTMVYTFNPFTRRAPNYWEEVDTIDKPNDKWTLYKQPFINDKSICQNLTFDKTEFLDGHEVKAGAIPELNETSTINRTRDIESCRTVLPYNHYLFLKTIFPVLNVTPIITYTSADNLNFQNGTHDIGLNTRYKGAEFDIVDYSELFYEEGYMILTQKRGMTQVFEQVSNFLDLETTLFIVFLLFITFIAIIRNNNRQYGLGLLDILSLILSRGILAPLNKLYIRVIFIIATVVIFFVTPALQGYFLSFITKPEVKNVETLQDLVDLKYNIYAHPSVEQILRDKLEWKDSYDKYLHLPENVRKHCYEKILTDDSTACLALYTFQLEMARKHKNLHLSKQFFAKSSMSFKMRKNWPLKNKFDKIAAQLRESGYLDYWEKQSFYYQLKKLKAIEAKKTSAENLQLALQDFEFGFLVFSMGLIFWTVVFGIENLIKRVIQKRRRAVRREPRFIKLRQRLRYRDGKIFIINEYL
ncbi:uncharacterized protein LOC130668070 [Microplitis mediator]|uniref:uncharacterized protein LOC130668070 n=1 Tax=Microplitis mediator TaxID=375433 RepID=UPI002553F7BB|nr:uncharacterized protein LOC130668070 [Microplitis mediator]